MQLFVESPAAGLKMCALLNLQIPQKRSENTCVSELAFLFGRNFLVFRSGRFVGPLPFFMLPWQPLVVGRHSFVP